MLNLLHMANRRSQLSPQSPLGQGLQELASLEIVEQCHDLDKAEILTKMRDADVIITMWGATPVPAELADDPGKVRYILNITGTVSPYVPIEIVRSDIPVTNWGDAPADVIAEGAMVLLLSVMKDIRARTESICSGDWGGARKFKIPSGSVKGLKLGLYGCGAIGNRFAELITPFKPEMTIYDPYINELPEECARVDSLEELFDNSEAVALFAGLSDQTRGSVDAALLAKLPDHGIIINVARGEIVDQEALFAELKSGRLRAGLDVLSDGDSLPPENEARNWPNLILTCHDINSALWPERPPQLSNADRNALDNLKRFISGEPLKFQMTEERYKLST